MKNKILNIIKGITIGALSLSLIAPSAMAGSITIKLYASQYKACSAMLGNTTGKYKVTQVVYSDSKSPVEEYMYYGMTSDHCGKIKDSWTVKPGKETSKSYPISKSSGTLARVTLYGNEKSDQEKGCRSKSTLANN